MPKKLNPETPEEQSKRFRKEARKLIKSGELDPGAGEAATDALVRKSRNRSGS
jgi:hypothetical protein